MAWPQHLCLPLPDPISNEEAVLLEPLGVALHALDLGRVGPGVSAGVFGCGPIGQLLVQLLLSAGAEVVVVSDPRPHRLAAALALGGSVAASERAELDLDVAFDVSGTDESLADALAAVRSAGRVVVVGIPSDDRTTFQASLARRKGLTILLSRRMRPEDLPRAIRLAEVRAVSLGPLVTESHSLQSAPLAFEALVAFRGTKIVVQSDAAGDASRVESTGRPRRN